MGLQFNKWQCIALTRSNGYVQFWIDDVSKAGPVRIPSTGTIAAMSMTTDPGWLAIGCARCLYSHTISDYNDNYQRMKGKIAELVIIKNTCLDMATVFPTLTKPTF